MAITVTERPPLDLYAEVQTPAGTTINWHSGASAPGNRPQGISFRTARYDGFKDGGCTLPRRIDQPQLDLELFNMLRFIGASGDIAYEGRMAALPRSTGTPPTWNIQAAGLMANAKDRKFAMPFVDRDARRWTEPSLARQIAVGSVGVSFGDFSFTAEQGGLLLGLPNQALGTQTVANLMLGLPTGTNVAKVMYQGQTTAYPVGWTASIRASDDETLSSSESYTPTLNDTLQTLLPTTARRYLWLEAYSNGTAATPAAGANLRYSKFAVYGDHGLTTQAIAGEPDGVLASDVVTWLIENYCPQLNAGGVQGTGYPIGHLSFWDRTYPYDAFLIANSFHRWGLECWEGGTVHYAPLDLTDYDWELRLDDFGTSLAVNGPVAEEVANGIEVTYTNVATGQTNTLLPDDHAELRDTNPLNAVNRAGGYKPTDYTISSPVLEDMALQIGRAALAEFNAPKHKGTATRRGYVKDRAGNWQPAWKVRAGERVLITDSVDEEVHVVYETDYQHDSHTVSIAVDDTFQRLDAYLDRYANALQATGVA